MIYTSGSTGRPKGVQIEHRAVINTLVWRSHYYGFGIDDVTLQILSFSFDGSVADIFTTLLSGSRLILIHPEKQLDVNITFGFVIEGKLDVQRLEEIVQALVRRHESILPPGRMKLFRDETKLQKVLAFWSEQLHGELPVLQLPYDSSLTNGKSRKSAAYRLIIPAEVQAKLHAIALELILTRLKREYPKIVTFFNLSNFQDQTHQDVDNLASYHIKEVQDVKFDLACYLTEYRNGIEVSCHYVTERFDAETIEYIMEEYNKLLKNITKHPEGRLNEYVEVKERRKILW